MSDADLLRNYADRGSEEAFSEIMSRYLNLVYSVAMRCLGNSESAQDVAQQVFCLLAKKAGTIPRDQLLIGWLYRATCHLSWKRVRAEKNRHRYESKAQEWYSCQEGESEELWSEVVPNIETAIAQLNGLDQTCLLLRFFRGHSWRDIGHQLGLSEDAARMRVNRALEEMRRFLHGKGIQVSSAVLGSLLSENAVQSAPSGLAGAIGTLRTSCHSQYRRREWMVGIREVLRRMIRWKAAFAGIVTVGLLDFGLYSYNQHQEDSVAITFPLKHHETEVPQRPPTRKIEVTRPQVAVSGEALDPNARVTLSFSGGSVSPVLRFYGKLSGRVLISTPGMQVNRMMPLASEHPLMPDQAMELIESALRDQAGLRILHLDHRRSFIVPTDDEWETIARQHSSSPQAVALGMEYEKKTFESWMAAAIADYPRQNKKSLFAIMMMGSAVEEFLVRELDCCKEVSAVQLDGTAQNLSRLAADSADLARFHLSARFLGYVEPISDRGVCALLTAVHARAPVSQEAVQSLSLIMDRDANAFARCKEALDELRKTSGQIPPSPEIQRLMNLIQEKAQGDRPTGGFTPGSGRPNIMPNPQLPAESRLK